MMLKVTAPLALAAILATTLTGCSGNPIGSGGGGGGGGGGTPSGIPASVALNLQSATFDPGAGTISVTLKSQDAAALNATYARDATFDVPGYLGYSYQQTTSNRFAVALVAEQGDVKALQVVDAGQFSTYFAGGTYARSGGFARPSAGVGASATYSGAYAGLQNTGVAAPGGPGGSLNPTIADRVTGRALITADFTDMSVSGGVDQRTNVRTGASYRDIALKPATIATDGTFNGTVDRLEPGGPTGAGTYGGIFGTQGANVASVLVFAPTSLPNLIEHGMIVLENCATGGGPACP